MGHVSTEINLLNWHWKKNTIFIQYVRRGNPLVRVVCMSVSMACTLLLAIMRKQMLVLCRGNESHYKACVVNLWLSLSSFISFLLSADLFHFVLINHFCSLSLTLWLYMATTYFCAKGDPKAPVAESYESLHKSFAYHIMFRLFFMLKACIGVN